MPKVLHKQPKMPNFITCKRCGKRFNRFIHPYCPDCGKVAEVES